MYQILREWIMNHARFLEKARFSYLFEDGDKRTYYEALQQYQNFDGGFGHGLEADCTNPDSSPIQSWFAFENIAELNLTKEDEMVRRLCEYLISSQRSDGFWPSTIPTNNDYPRAPWWSHKEEACVWGYNPTAAILGFLYRHGESNRWKTQVEQAMVDLISMDKVEMHELKCFLDMYDFLLERRTEFSLFDQFEQKLSVFITQIVERDYTKWLTSYVPRPIQLCQRNGDLASKLIEPLVIQELRLLKEEFLKNGIWPITWQWGQFEAEFQSAKLAWQGVFAMLILRMLIEFHLL